MEVTLSTGQALITHDDGTQQVINLNNLTDWGSFQKNYIGQEPVSPISAEITLTPSYFVRLHEADQRYVDIFMGTVENQAGWTNDLDGANECVADIQAYMA